MSSCFTNVIDYLSEYEHDVPNRVRHPVGRSLVFIPKSRGLCVRVSQTLCLASSPLAKRGFGENCAGETSLRRIVSWRNGLGKVGAHQCHTTKIHPFLASSLHIPQKRSQCREGKEGGRKSLFPWPFRLGSYFGKYLDVEHVFSSRPLI